MKISELRITAPYAPGPCVASAQGAATVRVRIAAFRFGMISCHICIGPEPRGHATLPPSTIDAMRGSPAVPISTLIAQAERPQGSRRRSVRKRLPSAHAVWTPASGWGSPEGRPTVRDPFRSRRGRGASKLRRAIISGTRDPSSGVRTLRSSSSTMKGTLGAECVTRPSLRHRTQGSTPGTNTRGSR
jgi:hypothetical protein